LPDHKQALIAIGVLWLALPAGAWEVRAQAALPRELPGAVEPGRDRPVPQAPARPLFDFTIEQPGRTQVPRAVEELHFQLTDIQIEGAVTLPAASFRPLFEPLIGKQVSVSDILDVADAIEDAYRKAGYVLTHAFVPPQRVRTGVFTITVVEGFVSAVTIEGGDPAIQELIRQYLQPVVGVRPLRLALMERALLLANDLPGVTAAGVLRPSPDQPGASDLVITLVEAPYSGGAAVDDRGSNFSGVWTLGADAEANSLLLAGDQFALSVAAAPDITERSFGQFRYRAPIGTNGMAASLIATVTHGQPASSLSQFNLLTDSFAVGPRLSYPIFRSRAESLVLDGGFTVQDATVTSLGAPFSHDQWRVADLSASYVRSEFFGGAQTASLDLAQGLPIFGATPNGSPNLSHQGAATDFTKLVGTLRHTRDLFGPFSLALVAQGQAAFAPLVVGEQITFGGNQIGRGYDPGAVSADQGAGGSIELRYSAHAPEYFFDLIQPYAFFDAGKVWNFQSSAGSTQRVASTGVGVRLFLPHAINADFEIARTLRAVPGSDNGKKATKLLMDASVRF
jgi:hemolysin activation/secretion protein